MRKLRVAVPFRVVVMAFAVVSLLHCRAAGAPYAVDGRAVKTVYPAKDWVVSDYVVTDFGAKAETDFINTELPLEDTDDGSRLTLNRQYVQRIHNGVWERITLAKKLVALYRLHRDLRENRRRQDLTDKNVLL